MTRAFFRLPAGTGVHDLERGGTIAADGEDVYAPEQIGTRPTGVAFGPLLLETPPGGVVPLESLTFLPGEDDDNGGLLAVTAAAGTTGVAARETEIDTPDVSRRGVLTFLVAIAAAATVADTAAADADELVALQVAKFELAEQPPAPVTVSVVDAVDEVLPPSTEILIDQRSARVGKVVDQGEGVTLRQTEGEVRIYVRDTIGRIAQLLAWARSFLPSDSSLTYRQPFPDDRLASEFETDEFVRLTEHPAIIEPIEAADEGRTILTINDHRVPHADDGANAVGAWSLMDGSLIWEAGPDPPDAEEWEVTTRLSAIQSIRRNYL